MKYFIILFIFFGLTSNAIAQTPFFAQYEKASKSWQYIDVNGITVLKLKIKDIAEALPFSDGLAAVQLKSTKMWGYINEAGEWQLQPTFDLAGDFKDGYAIVSNFCKKNCNKKRLGFVDDYSSQIIDKSGTIVLTDKSQVEDSTARYAFNYNLGSKFFTIILGTGYGDVRNFIDITGKILGETHSIYDQYVPITFDDDLQAVRCKNKYYDKNNKVILDFSKYTYLQDFSEGKIWVNEEIKSNGELTVYHILFDKEGKEIARFNSNEIGYPQPVIDGKFLYKNINYETCQYDLETKKSAPFKQSALEEDDNIIFKKLQKNGCKFFNSSASGQPLLGFMNAQHQVFYKNL